MNKYKTFWRRLGAAFLDFGALAPIYWIDEAIWANVKVPLILAMWLIVSDFLGWVYAIAMHGLYGQTLGKFVCQVKVLDKSETPLQMRQAFYRDAVPIFLFLPLSFYQIGNVMRGHIAEKGLQMFPHVWPFAIIGVSWFLLELITMLTNKKRRAVHDYIAGSVVVTCPSEETQLARKVILSRGWLLVILGTMFVVTHGIAWFAR
jgi:uncharacterized RDD family membrane protein YckC